MIKNIQLKIILIFSVIGIVIIGIIFIYNLSNVDIEKMNVSENEIQAFQNIVETQVYNVRVVSIILVFVYGIICIIIGVFVSKVILDPIARLIDTAPKIAAGENFEIKEKEGKKVDELTNAFNIMTNELRQNLNEVNRQKKQIETILLHMTDGIIAFDIEGNIMHINPAAVDLLKLSNKDNNFQKIFEKIGTDINLEKTIYLENWTSSEQRVQVEDKYLNIFFATFKDENDRPSGIMVVLQDITEHVKLDNMRKEFVADVSHELKTPITSIMGYADTLIECDYDKETQDKFLNVISSEARRMAKLVSDLLTLSRYDNNRAKKEVTEFDLGELVKKCQEKLQLEINKKNHLYF